MFLVRSDDAGLVFLAAQDEESAALESLRTSHPDRHVRVAQRGEGLVLFHVSPAGDPGSLGGDLAIGRVELPPRKPT